MSLRAGSESWVCLLLLEEVWIGQQNINPTGRDEISGVASTSLTLWFVALRGHGGDKSACEPDSFTANTFLPTSISQRAEAALWQTRWPIKLLLLVFVAEMNKRSTWTQLMFGGGWMFREMHRWNMTLSGLGAKFRKASCYFYALRQKIHIQTVS